MSEERDDQHKAPQRHADEPVYVPSQAEGAQEEDDEQTLHLRTGGQAEGTREDVEEALAEQEKHDQKQRKHDDSRHRND